MFDIWSIKESDLSEGEKIIRVEFELKREVLFGKGCNCTVGYGV